MKKNQQLKLARIRAGLTQQQLARFAGIPENLISKLETGRIQPSPVVFEALRRHLSLPKSDLFASELWENRQSKQGEQ